MNSYIESNELCATFPEASPDERFVGDGNISLQKEGDRVMNKTVLPQESHSTSKEEPNMINPTTGALQVNSETENHPIGESLPDADGGQQESIQPNKTRNKKRAKCKHRLFGSTSQGFTDEISAACFSTKATVIFPDNIPEFFRYHHSPIKRRCNWNGSMIFVHAMAMTFCVENNHSDNPAEWVRLEDIEKRLKEMGISFWIIIPQCSSVPDEGRVFRVYLPFSTACDKETYLYLCRWCTETFNIELKSPEKMMVRGLGNTPYEYKIWEEGRCVNTVLCAAVPDADAARTTSSKKRQSNKSIVQSPTTNLGEPVMTNLAPAAEETVPSDPLTTTGDLEMCSEIEIHPYCAMFPAADERTLNDLADNILKNGMVEPITTFEDKILDGRNRFRACKMVDVTPTFTEYKGNDPLGYVVAKNLHRRRLDESQRAACAQTAFKLSNGSMTIEQLAQQFKVGKKTVLEAGRIQNSMSEKVQQGVANGDIPVHKAIESLKKAQKVTGTKVTKTSTPEDKEKVQEVQERILNGEEPVETTTYDRNDFNRRVIEGHFDGRLIPKNIEKIRKVVSSLEELPALFEESFTLIFTERQETDLNALLDAIPRHCESIVKKGEELRAARLVKTTEQQCSAQGTGSPEPEDVF